MELLKPSRIQDEPFTFQINESEYTIKETCQEEIKRHIKNDDNDFYYGLTVFQDDLIYLEKSLSYDKKRKTLIHELMHVHIAEFITTQTIDYDEEILCDICANVHELVNEIVNSYFEEDKHE